MTENTQQNMILKQVEQGVATITLNRPEALNALSTPLRNQIIETFANLATDAAIEAIVLTGAGRAFTVGLDLKELGGETDRQASPDPRNLLEVMAAVPQPIIGAVNGFAITGGFELALMCDFLIASPNAAFADTHARVGVVPGWGLSQRLPRLIGINRAKELSLTGNFLDAQTAADWGLVNRIVPADELLATCQQLARDIVSTDRDTRSEIKRIMDAGWESTLVQGLAVEQAATQAHDRKTRPAAQVAARRAAIQDRGRTQTKD